MRGVHKSLGLHGIFSNQRLKLPDSPLIIEQISESPGGNLKDNRSFEEPVVARFCASDNRINELEKRLEALKIREENRDVEPKPIGERGFAEILQIKDALAPLNRKVDVLALDILTVRAHQFG